MASSALFQPLKLGSITVPNRIFMSALTRNRAYDKATQQSTVPTDLMVEYYAQRARGGTGLIISEGTLITRQGTEWPHAPGIWSEEQVVGWRKITDAVHAAGSHIYAQIWHLGRLSHPDAPEQILAGVPVYAPSAVSARGGRFRHIPGEPGYVTPTAVEDPWTLVALFKQAAVNARKAGFDGVEIHGAGGYLISQFLDSGVNRRTDQWGGSIENRARFGIEVFKAAKEVFGDDVAIKVMPCGGFNDFGMPLQETLDTYNYFLSEIDKLHPSFVTLIRYSRTFDAQFDGVLRATQHDVLSSYRKLFTNAKVVINNQVTPEEGLKLVEEGQADAIAIGLNYVTHPDVAKRVQHGKPLDNAPDFTSFQWKGEMPLEVGYTDYPEARYD